MKRAFQTAGVLALITACGTPAKPPVDAGKPVDTSCGIDCDAQKEYGLLLNSCLEFADGPTAVDPPALGIFVREVFTLEGNVKVLVVEYLQSGQKKMTDSVGIVDGKLKLMRREFSGGQSVTYKNAANEIVGVDWLSPSSAAGSSLESTSNADVLLGGSNRKSESTTYRVTLDEAPASQITVPAAGSPFTGAVRMSFSETPDHGSDGLRVWMPKVGFIFYSSSFTLAGGTAPQYRLQRARTVGEGDGGDKACSLGTP